MENKRKSTLESTLASTRESTPISESTPESTLGSTFGGFPVLGSLAGRQTLNHRIANLAIPRIAGPGNSTSIGKIKKSNRTKLESRTSQSPDLPPPHGLAWSRTPL